jgi:hypothetical protein
MRTESDLTFFEFAVQATHAPGEWRAFDPQFQIAEAHREQLLVG